MPGSKLCGFCQTKYRTANGKIFAELEYVTDVDMFPHPFPLYSPGHLITRLHSRDMTAIHESRTLRNEQRKLSKS